MGTTTVDTILHAERLVHHFFGEIDILAILQERALSLEPGDRGVVRLPDGREVGIRVKSVWSKEPDEEISGKVIIVAPLDICPSHVEGCAIEWTDE